MGRTFGYSGKKINFSFFANLHLQKVMQLFTVP